MGRRLQVQPVAKFTVIRNTLFGKLLLLFLGFGALMTAAFVYVMGVSHETYHSEFEQTAKRDLARQYVDANLLIREPPLTAHNFANALRHITEINPGNDLYVLDADGRILASSIDTRASTRRRIALAPIREFLADQPEFPLWGEDPARAGRREVFSAARLSIPGCPAAYLYIVLHGEQHSSAAGGLKTLYAIREGVGVVLVAIVLALAGSLLLLRMLTRRLGALKQDIEQFRDSEFLDASLAIERDPSEGDEVERLRLLFMQLVAKIRGQMRELQKTDELRRELLTNVSHDLRTPLATLSAHLESLLLKDDLPSEDRRSYLTTAFAQCGRLSKLVEQLLELAKLDAGQTPFVPEPFPLAELAHDIIHKFELSARRAQVALRIEHAETLPLVLGDVRLIEQVFDNLLNNALRHVTQGGEVRVTMTQRPTTVRVEVHDTGPGIPASEHHRVFDRFYRGDKSRPTDSGFFGLGLAIVRGILELHRHSIDFVSTPNQGTTFFFELSIAGTSSASGGPHDSTNALHGAAA